MPLLNLKNRVFLDKEPYADVYKAHLPQNTIGQAYSVSTDKTELRDLLNSELSGLKSSGKDPSGSWSNEIWDHKATFKKAVLYGIHNTDHNPYATYNFKNCDWSHTNGTIHQSLKGDKTYREKMSCGEKLCLRCDHNKRKRKAAKAVSELKALFHGNPGAPGIMFITFTLPEQIEKKPLQDPEQEKSLKNKICKIIKELFGVKTRSNIGLRLAVHSVGSSDVMRDRWHCHVEIIPGEVVKKNGAFIFRWLTPKMLREGTINNWIIDLVWLRDRWKQELEDFYNGDEVANPQVEFLEYDPDKRKQKRYWQKVGHRLSYNLRSFARDFENRFLRSKFDQELMILSGSRGDIGYWYKLTAYEVVERFAEVRKKTLFRKRGFLSCMAKYKDAIILIYPKEESIDDCYDPVAAEIYSIYKKEYDDKQKKWLTIRKEIWTWICPRSGEKKQKESKDLIKWKNNYSGKESNTLEKEQ
ncbi:hypothetical protein ES705_11656 [subsurface metagenome]